MKETISYEVDEEVLVEYNTFYYLAKVQCIKEENNIKLYHVKYNRFSTQYNEDVTIERLKKATPETIEAEETRKREYIQKHKLSKRSGNSSKNLSSSAALQGTIDSGNATTVSTDPETKSTKNIDTIKPNDNEVKRMRSNDAREGNDQSQKRHHLQLRISSELRKILWKDYIMIERYEKILQLPRTPCVANIISQYIVHLREACCFQEGINEESNSNSNNNSIDDSTKVNPLTPSKTKRNIPQIPEKRMTQILFNQALEVMIGIRSMFDKALSATLLHRYERTSFEREIRNTGREDNPSLVYGFEHLLRFFVKFPTLLPTQTMSSEELAAVQYHTNDFLAWLTVHYKRFCSNLLMERISSETGSTTEPVTEAVEAEGTICKGE